ncbi:hypothetical protein ACHAXA_010891 [Cyclostephanos tholiformis]|uniref:Crossover junction endonuclease MUS81 n=1 Tax=Cyclostephanos tholiformis TaxID=382380 RepID=A0ABD3RME3_9STRA
MRSELTGSSVVMDVITIDSSDDDDEAASEIIRKEGAVMTSTSRDVLNVLSDDDDSSTSSDDIIWKTMGLSSRAKNFDSVADNDALPGMFTERCVIGPMGNADESRRVAQFEDGSVSSSGLDIDETISIPPYYESDESSISSADSIWDKSGLAPRGVAATSPDPPAAISPDLHDSKSDRARTSEDAADDERAGSTPLEVPSSVGGTWRIVLLMDHREFGCANDFLNTVQGRINERFGGEFAEITTLPAADYMFVSRLISNATGEVMEERVLDMIIERKNVKDVCHCLIASSKKYKPLSFFNAQMYKLQHSGISKKLFLMEGDEDNTKNMFAGAKSNMEKERRLKRLENGEFDGVDLICTRNRFDTLAFLIQQLESFQKSFNPMHPPTKTMEQLKLHINEQMKAPTFLEYLRLRSQSGVGDVKAMKVIMDPTLNWDKAFVSPCSTKMTKSSLNDRATFWPAKSINAKDRTCINPYRFTSKQPSAIVNKVPKSENDCQLDSKCGICNVYIDIWLEKEIMPCSRVAACGAIFHKSCLKSYEDCDGCIICKSQNQFSTKYRERGVARKANENRESDCDYNYDDRCSTINNGLLDSAKRSAPVIALDTDDE